jgi:hypothetical protein
MDTIAAAYSGPIKPTTTGHAYFLPTVYLPQ